MKCSRNCMRRTSTCHFNCEEYADEVVENKAKKDMIRKAKNVERETPTRIARRYERVKRYYAK
ncbi:MAG: hypothetical protein Q4B18_07905 [Bacillota bacterium]|nr:hypothetical protein [Bacillota bacterium]